MSTDNPDHTNPTNPPTSKHHTTNGSWPSPNDTLPTPTTTTLTAEPPTPPALPQRRALRAAAALEAKNRANTNNHLTHTTKNTTNENLREVITTVENLSAPIIKICELSAGAAKAQLRTLTRWTAPAIRHTAKTLVPQQRLRNTNPTHSDGDEPVDNPITGSINRTTHHDTQPWKHRQRSAMSALAPRHRAAKELASSEPEQTTPRTEPTGLSPGQYLDRRGCADQLRASQPARWCAADNDPIDACGVGPAGIVGSASVKRGAALLGGLVSAGAQRMTTPKAPDEAGLLDHGGGPPKGRHARRAAHAAPGRLNGPSLALLCAVGLLFTITAVNTGLVADRSNVMPLGAAAADLEPVLCEEKDHYVRCWHETDQRSHPASLAKAEVFDEVVGVMAVLGDDTIKYLMVPADVIGTVAEKKLASTFDAAVVIGVADGKADGHALASSGAEQVALHLLGNNSCTDGLMRDTDTPGDAPASSRLITVVDGPVAARAVTALLRGDELPEGHRFYGWTLHDFQRAAATHRRLGEFCEQQSTR